MEKAIKWFLFLAVALIFLPLSLFADDELSREEQMIGRIRRTLCWSFSENDFSGLQGFLERASTQILGTEMKLEEAYLYLRCYELGAGSVDLLRVTVENPYSSEHGFQEMVYYFAEEVPDKTLLGKILSCNRDFGHGCLNVFEHLERNLKKAEGSPVRVEAYNDMKWFLYGVIRAADLQHDAEFCREFLEEPPYCSSAENTSAIIWSVAEVPARDGAEAELPRPGSVFQDCEGCPEMVWMPAGSFLMGSPLMEEGRYGDEGPVHQVTIGEAFAVGVSEVTRREFSKFVTETGYETGDSCWNWDNGEWKEEEGKGWRDPGYRQTELEPVVCVSWEDAQAYVSWLRSRTGEGYRLPSEAEWEYAARGGTRTARYWGESASDQCWYGNGADETLKSHTGNPEVATCDDGYYRTAPAGSFRVNGYWLHDMLGNVWEWVADCWNESYAGAPSDGSAWETGECGRRMHRGGAWLTSPGGLRSANRRWVGSGIRSFDAGFRVALGVRRDLLR